ncbi:hypothetical protein BKA93DRAFT_542061 [Sparassis latifolia]
MYISEQLQLRVAISFSSTMSNTSCTAVQTSVKTALAESLAHGEFADVRLFVFSRRLRSGKVCAPRALYANSAILKAASPFFAGMLAGGFSESDIAGIDTGFPANQRSVIDADPFAEEDSDYEEGEDDEYRKDNSTIARDACDEVESSGLTLNSTHVPQDTPASLVSPAVIKQSGGQPLRTIIIKDTALATLQWLVYYLYTGEIAFSPLHSQGAECWAVERERYQIEHPKCPPPCSPKSMYRLADMLGMDGLKLLAIEDVRSKLSAENILDELFSPFSSWYPEILQAEVKFFSSNRMDLKIIPKMRKKLAAIAIQPVPHAAVALASLFEACISEPEGAAKTVTSSVADMDKDRVAPAESAPIVIRRLPRKY